MTQRAVFDTIELHLVRVFHTVISERSVSRAAMRLSSTQPQVSAQLRRLRALIGDPLLVRAGAGMVPTEIALQLMAPAETLLRSAEQLFGGKAGARAFTPGAAEIEFRIAASDYLDPLFLPMLVARLRQQAPRARLTIHALSAEFDYRARLARGEVDLVIGNWLEPPAELHIGRLFSDEIVCLVGAGHLAARRPREWTLERYLAADHVAPTALHTGGHGGIDEQLTRQGLPTTLDDLASHALIGFDSTTPLVRRALQAYPRFQREAFAMRTESDLAQLSLIRAGAGIGICQVPLADGIIPLQRVLAADFSLYLDTWLVMHEDLRHSPACKRVFDFLAQGLQAYIRGPLAS